MNRPRLYLFIGYPGSGKTTIAQIIQQATGAVHIWADKERLEMFSDPQHSHEESQQLYGQLNEQTGQLLRMGKSVIFDTNFNFRKDRDHLRSIAAKFGAETAVIWVTTPKEVAKQRAVSESEGRATRLFGNMAESDFERIAGHLQEPDESETVLKIDGTNLDEAELKRILGL